MVGGSDPLGKKEEGEPTVPIFANCANCANFADLEAWWAREWGKGEQHEGERCKDKQSLGKHKVKGEGEVEGMAWARQARASKARASKARVSKARTSGSNSSFLFIIIQTFTIFFLEQ